VTPKLDEAGVPTADARILGLDNGSEVALSDAARIGTRPPAWSLDGRKRLVARPMARGLPSGCREAVTVVVGGSVMTGKFQARRSVQDRFDRLTSAFASRRAGNVK
jgi:hypothetical protein